MSEPVLKAIMHLFAFVAKEDQITAQERDRIRAFLEDHLGQRAVEAQLTLFDQFSAKLTGKLSPQQEDESIVQICQQVNAEVTQKQKAVVMIELMDIILADGKISDREDHLSKVIGRAFNIALEDIDLIKEYVLGRNAREFNSTNILVIDSVKEVTAKHKHIFREKLNWFIAILYIKSTDIYFFKYIGHSDVFLNGVPQKPGNINVLGTGSTMRWEDSDPVYYGDVLRQFKKMGDGTRTSFEAKNISYQFKNGKLGLRDVNVLEESGKLIALMGASGAGKSTLLHVLNGTEKPSQGQVLINGIDIHKTPEKIEGIIGFVPQDDLLIEDLTVYQNLYFAAKLCFSQLSEKQINDLVITTLNDLGLTQTKDLKVGSPLQKTISGG